ncbi:MAG TPA: PAS domain S-box protein, partial [Methylotenera sp.]|nr:PAS domain S-box protein [Methylotenera sp.]
MQRLKTTYLNFSLRSKISWALITSVSVVCGLVMLASYMNAYHLIIDHTHELLNSEAKLDKRELEIKLSAEIQSASEVANNFITANALADTEQSQLYLVPFLKNQKHAFKGTALSVLDYRGRLIAANLNQIIDYQVHPIFSRMMETGVLQASVHQNLHSEPVLMLAIPVQYRLSGEVEGGVVLEIPLNAVLQDKLENNFHWLEDINNKVVAGKKPILDDLLVSAKHEISLPIPEIKLAYYLAHDRERALQKINTMLIGYLGIALMAVLGLLAFARFSARYISEPLEYLSKVAQQVTSSGRPRSHINIQSKDEYGALAKAFNTMFVRLDEVYQSLEGRVKLRTQELEKAKADAEAARNLLNEAVANAIHGFCIFNQEDKLVVCNEAYRQFTQLGDYIEIGRSYEEILTKQVEQKVFPDSIGREQAWIAQRMQHHLKADASFVEVKRADNRWFMAQEVRSPSGYLIASRIDITEFKRVTDALTQRELYLQATLDNLPFLFWLKDAQSRLLAINKVYAEACDLDRPEDAVGKTEFDLWPPAIAERLHADDDEVIANMREKTTEQIIDEKYGLSWLEIYKKPVMTEDGKVMGTVGFARDITDRKNVELALAEAEMRWSLAMHGANDGVWDWNLQTNQVFYSERWKTMLGFEDEEVGDAADEWQLRVHPDDLQRSLDLVQAHLKGETEFYYNEHRLRCKDGS